MSDVFGELKKLRRELDRMKRLSIDRPVGPAAVANYLMLPGLKAFWPMSSAAAQLIYDVSGQERHLARTGGVNLTIYNDAVPCVALDGATGYISRAHEAALNPGANPLTLMAWVVISSGPMERWAAIIGKNLTSSRGYLLYKLDTDQIRAMVSSDGTAQTTVTSTDAVAVNRPYFVCMRYVPSTELALFVSGQWFRNTSGIPASVNATTTDFNIGASNGGTANFLSGRVMLPALCAGVIIPDELIENIYQSTRGLFGV